MSETTSARDNRAAAGTEPAETGSQRRSRSASFYRTVSLATIVGALVAWFVVTGVLGIGTRVLVPPDELLAAAQSLVANGYGGTPLWEHVGTSVLRMLAGFGLAAVVGIPVGVTMGMSRLVRAMLAPALSLLRPIPSIAYIPLVIIWLGIGEISKVAVVFLAAFLYILPATIAGVSAVPEGWRRVARNLGASKTQMFAQVIIPGSLPYIFTALKTGLGVSWTVMVAAELIAAQEGLGFMIMDAATFFRIPVVYIGVFLIGVIGLAMATLLEVLESKMLHWSGR